jgi:hypothetical protein
MTSSDTPYWWAVTLVADPKILEQNEMEKMTANGAKDRSSFSRRAQFCGFSGSWGPFQVTSSNFDTGSFGGEAVPGVEAPSGTAIRLTWTPCSRLCAFAGSKPDETIVGEMKKSGIVTIQVLMKILFGPFSTLVIGN